MDAGRIKQEVQEWYGEIALNRSGGCCGSSGGSDCCSPSGAQTVALLDSLELQDQVIGEADLGLGCGLPTQFAGLRLGQTVLDLGSGAGVDVFRASKTVGPEGRVIGVDMTPAMIARAWANAAKGGYQNVDFRLGDIEDLPVKNDSVDVVLSNCVINLAPDKGKVFREIWRVLKPGGQFSISDVVLYGQVPETVRQDMALWAGCIAGAMDQEAYLQLIGESGFMEVKVNSLVKYDAYQGQDYGVASITVEGRKG